MFLAVESARTAKLGAGEGGLLAPLETSSLSRLRSGLRWGGLRLHVGGPGWAVGR